MKLEQNKKRRWLRFSFATMLFLIACLCGFMGGFRSGYHAGDRAWKYNQVYPQTYNVADLVASKVGTNAIKVSDPDLENLVLAMKDATAEMKDLCQIRPIKGKLTMVVAANQVGHERIADMLHDLRKSGPKEQVEETETRGVAGGQWATRQKK